jgi:glycerol kinase
MTKYIAAVDQGTTSTRFAIFDRSGAMIASAQREHRQIFPRPGWVEHDPVEIWDNTRAVIGEAMASAGLTGRDLAGIGITNQRETTLVWDRSTGRPLYHAVVWQCTRTHEICKELMADGGQDRFRQKTGLPVATYFSGPKMKWLMDNVVGVRRAVESGRALFGTMETWLIWWLTGGPAGGSHVSDVTNASRTLLMDLAALDWDPELLEVMGIPRRALPRIVPSSDAPT